MPSFLKNIRWLVFIGSLLVAYAIFIYVVLTIDDPRLEMSRLTQWYGFTASLYLYLTLLCGPFCYSFKKFPYKTPYIKSRRALGLSTWFFALLHGIFAFFGMFGGFKGLPFISSEYLLPMFLGYTALVIFTAMASTSSDYMVDKFSFGHWKILHRFIYIAAFLALIHALMIGSHFEDISEIIPQVFFVLLFFLLILEAMRVDNFLRGIFKFSPKWSPTVSIVIGIAIALLIAIILPQDFTLSIHSNHEQEHSINMYMK